MQFPVADGKFQKGFVFASQGTYTLNLFGGSAKQTQIPMLGTYAPITVVQSNRPVDLPIDYFNNIQLNAPLPTQIRSTLSLSGTVHKSSIDVLLVVFQSKSKEEIEIEIPVLNGTFQKDITPESTRNTPEELR